MSRKSRLVRGKDYVIDDDGSWEFTRQYLMNLGQCCKNKCRYCPYRKPAAQPGHSAFPPNHPAGPSTPHDRQRKPPE